MILGETLGSMVRAIGLPGAWVIMTQEMILIPTRVMNSWNRRRRTNEAILLFLQNGLPGGQSTLMRSYSRPAFSILIGLERSSCPCRSLFHQNEFFLEGRNTQGMKKKGVRLVFGHQFVDPPVDLFPLLDVVFPSPFLPEPVDLRISVGDEVKPFLNLTGMPDLIVIGIDGEAPPQDTGIEMFYIDEVLQKDAPLIEFKGDIDPDLSKLPLDQDTHIPAGIISAVGDQRETERLSVLSRIPSPFVSFHPASARSWRAFCGS